MVTTRNGRKLERIDELLSLCIDRPDEAAELLRERGTECAAWVRSLAAAQAAPSGGAAAAASADLAASIEEAQRLLKSDMVPPQAVLASLIARATTPPAPPSAASSAPPSAAAPSAPPDAGATRSTLWQVMKHALTRSRAVPGPGRTTRFLQFAAEDLRWTRRQLRRVLVAAACGIALLAAAIVWLVLHWPGETGFRPEVFERARRSIVLIVCHWKPAGSRAWIDGRGTGFVVGPGLVATNKHVVKPWLFRGEFPLRRGEPAPTAPVEPDAVEYYLFLEDNPVTREALDPRTNEPVTEVLYAEAPFSTPHGEVGLPRTAADDFDGGFHAARSDADVAVLPVKGLDRPALALDPARRLAAGDRLLALGFPSSIAKFEDGTVRVARREFTVEQMQHRIMLEQSAQGGLSGGPLVTADGKVVGIVSGVLGPSEGHGGTQAYAIRVEHLAALLRR